MRKLIGVWCGLVLALSLGASSSGVVLAGVNGAAYGHGHRGHVKAVPSAALAGVNGSAYGHGHGHGRRC